MFLSAVLYATAARMTAAASRRVLAWSCSDASSTKARRWCVCERSSPMSRAAS